MLKLLRKLLNQQQFGVLCASAERYFDESGDIQALPLLALAYAHAGQGDKVQAMEPRLQQHLNAFDIDAQVDLAAVLIYLGNADQATLLLQTALRQQPRHALALAQLAWLAMRDGNQDEAIRLFDASFVEDVGVLAVWLNLVRLRLAKKDLVGAQDVLDQAIAGFQAHLDEYTDESILQQKAALRLLQLEIWNASDDLAQAEDWLERRASSLAEDEWVPLVIGWANLSTSRDNHARAEEALSTALKRYPENVSLHVSLAEMAQMLGRDFQAALLMRRAIGIAEKKDGAEHELIELRARFAEVSLSYNPDGARESALKALELAEKIDVEGTSLAGRPQQAKVRALTSLARVESQQHYEAAEKLYGQVLAIDSNYLPALQAFGYLQLQRGRIDEAVALFERVRSIDPARGYSALINAHQFPDNDDALLKLEQFARMPNLQGSVNAAMLFQLVSAWEERKNYDKAFALANEANEANRRCLTYDAQAHRERSARIRHAFPRALYENRQGYGIDTMLPVYVVGMPRSGTTLVEQVLAGHSRICGAGELGIISQVLAGIERWERHTGSGRGYPDCIDDLTEHVTRGIAENVLRQLQEFDPDAHHVIDKLPHNFENIGLIKFLFPNARIISVRRDPRDIAVSNFFTDFQAKHTGMGFAYDLRDIGEQLADHNLMMSHWHQLFPGEILEVNYEDLVDDLEGVSRKMLAYIGVDWEPGVLAFNELDRPVTTASSWQVRQPVFKTSKARWMNYQSHLARLYEGTNAKITWSPIEMATLPEPGLLTDGVEFYRQGKLDDAERALKKLLHHIPGHAAANFMVGLIYIHKGYMNEAIELMEKGFSVCPWNANWRKDLIQFYEMSGDADKAEALKQKV